MKQLCFLLFPLALGCGASDEAEPLAPRELHRVPGCESIDPARCDVRLPECQQRLLDMAACLRGESVLESPAVQVLSEADYASYLTQRLTEPMQNPNLEQIEIGFNLLGLIERGTLSAQARAEENAKFAWGVYRDDTKDILIIDHGDSFEAEAVSPTLVHEFVHALQDRDLDLTAFEAQANSTDESWTYSAMIEGEARLHETRYAVAMLGLDPTEVNLTAHFQNALVHDEQRLLDEASPYLASYKYFPYEWGSRYMHFTWLAGGMDAVLGRFAAPPTMTHTLLASTMDAADSDITPSDLALAAAPAEWTQIARRTLGAWGTYLAFEKAARTLASARAMALAWRGDSLAIYASSETQPHTAVLWRMEFVDEAMATQVRALAEQIVGVANVHQKGPSVIIAKTDGSLRLDWAFQFE